MTFLGRITADLVAQAMPTAPIANIRANLPDVLTALAEGPWDRTIAIMAIATIRAETGVFLPLSEMVSKYNTPPGGPPFALYDFRADLGNQGPPDGERFRGRGYVQLTGRANYQKFGRAVGSDLEATPELACDSYIAARLLAAFLYANKEGIEAAIQSNDLERARRLVNGGRVGFDQFQDTYQRADALFPAEL